MFARVVLALIIAVTASNVSAQPRAADAPSGRPMEIKGLSPGKATVSDLKAKVRDLQWLPEVPGQPIVRALSHATFADFQASTTYLFYDDRLESISVIPANGSSELFAAIFEAKYGPPRDGTSFDGRPSFEWRQGDTLLLVDREKGWIVLESVSVHRKRLKADAAQRAKDI